MMMMGVGKTLIALYLEAMVVVTMTTMMMTMTIMTMMTINEGNIHV